MQLSALYNSRHFTLKGKPMDYTVVALWLDTMERCAWHCKDAASPKDAERIAKVQAMRPMYFRLKNIKTRTDLENPLLIAGVYEGLLVAVDSDRDRVGSADIERKTP